MNSVSLELLVISERQKVADLVVQQAAALVVGVGAIHRLQGCRLAS